MASAPASCGARDKAPPPWRSSTEASCAPEPGPIASTSESIAEAGRSWVSSDSVV